MLISDNVIPVRNLVTNQPFFRLYPPKFTVVLVSFWSALIMINLHPNFTGIKKIYILIILTNINSINNRSPKILLKFRSSSDINI